jgi:ganglioside-induced differentiation-associated protein 2
MTSVEVGDDPLRAAADEEAMDQFRKIEVVGEKKATIALSSLTCWQDALNAQKPNENGLLDSAAAAAANSSPGSTEEDGENVNDNGQEKEQEKESNESAAASSSSSSSSREVKFPFRQDLNRLIYLWRGDFLKLDVAAVTNSTNEPLTDRSGLCGRIFAAAGSELRREVERLEGCRTGESKLSRGYNLNARAIVHTVGPRYNIKYKTAAENALHNCYRSSLQLTKENGLASIAFCVINSEKRGYPPLEGAHIAIRTVRRFLERHAPGIDAVVFAMHKGSNMRVYEKVLPLYFPRSAEEQARAVYLLPEYTGNDVGETVVAERKIRIAAMPGLGGSGDDGSDGELMAGGRRRRRGVGGAGNDSDSDSDDELNVGNAFARMQGDVDASLLAEASSRQRQHAADTLYQTYLNRAKQADLSDMARRNLIYQCGTTSLGKPIVVVVGSHFPQSRNLDDMERCFLYIIRTMDSIVEQPYVVVYLHARLRDSQRPDIDWLRKIYDIWDQKYSTNLDALYILHPTFWLKVFAALVKPFISTSFTRKLRYVVSLEQLYDIIDHEQLRLPDFIYDEDARLHGRPASGHQAVAHTDL